MAQTSGFFNALNVDGVYDRKYNANDYCDNLAVVISNGVLRSKNDDLKVTANGMTASVGVGRAWINGHYYYNKNTYTFASVTAPAGGSRYDRVILRLSTELADRDIKLIYRQGTAADSPQKPDLIRTSTVYELVLADILVTANATTLGVEDTRADADVCGWVYSTSGDNSFFKSLDNSFSTWFSEKKDTLASVTLFKCYTWYNVLQAATSTVQFNIPQYDKDTCFIEVYMNGVLDVSGVDYTVTGTYGNVINFTHSIPAGSDITVKCYKSIDGTGINSVADEITELQNKVATLEGVSDCTYKCTGLNDNISLSQIAQALYSGSYVSADVTTAAAAFLENLGGNTYLAALASDSQITINVVGKMGVSTAFSGTGTSTSRYKWFALGTEAAGDKKITFDFAACEKTTIWCTGGTENIIIYGTDLNIKNLNIDARCNATGCVIEMISGRYNYGRINCTDCNFTIRTTGRALIAKNGTFTNCYCYASSSDTHSFCFNPATDSFIRLIGGTYYAYTASANAGNISAIFYTYSTDPNAVIMAYNISCPVVAVQNFYQKYLSVAYGGKTYINGVVTTLDVTGNYNEVVGKVEKSKR